jgi:hypothetical protein
VAAIQQILFAGASAATVGESLLREDGFYVLREDGGRILLETAVTGDALLLETGDYLLREDGGKVLLEGVASPEVPSTALLDTNGLPLLDTSGGYILEV